MTNRPKLALHIGHFKTGTTALQTFLNYNRPRLAEARLAYCTASLDHSKHSELALSCLNAVGVTHLLHGSQSPTPPADLWAPVFDEARATPDGHTLIVSSEEFMRLGNYPEAFAYFAEIVGNHDDVDLSVIAYLRPPQTHLRSWYNQLIKMGEQVGSFETAVRLKMETIHWDYEAALAPWIGLVGAERVHLRSYLPELRKDGALVRDFFGIFGSEPPPDAYDHGRDPNPRMDDRLLDISRGIGWVAPKSDVWTRSLGRMKENLIAEDGGMAMINAPDFATIQERAKQGLESLAQLPNASLDTEALLKALPEPRSDIERFMSTQIGLLSAELTESRAFSRRLATRLNKLEAELEKLSSHVKSSSE